jgi:hypothetical protein
VSDLVGYVLMVAVILVGVGLTATVGVDAIEQARMNQHTQGAERGMELIDGHVDDLQQSQAAVRSTELALGGGGLSVNGSDARSAITVNVSGTGDSPTRYSMGSLTYRYGEAVVAFEGGGVFQRSPRGNPVTVAEPTLLCDDDRALVSVVTLQGPALNHNYGGDVPLVFREHNSSVLFPVNRTGADSQAEATGVNVTVHSEHASAWNETLQDGSEWAASSDPAGPRLRCVPDDGTVYVRRTVVNVTARR